MRKGEKVRVCGIVSDRGVTFATLEDLRHKRVVGKVVSGPDEIGCVEVQFDAFLKPLEIPRELLTRAR